MSCSDSWHVSSSAGLAAPGKCRHRFAGADEVKEVKEVKAVKAVKEVKEPEATEEVYDEARDSREQACREALTRCVFKRRGRAALRSVLSMPIAAFSRGVRASPPNISNLRKLKTTTAETANTEHKQCQKLPLN